MGLLLLIAFVVITATLSTSLEQQHSQQQQRPSAPLLGTRYSAATDVSHVSFNSPLVTYGSSLNEIQLPAAPIRPANLKQAPQTTVEDDESTLQTPPALRNIGQTQQLQSSAPDNQPQFISVQQYPANPQLQSNPQSFTLTQQLPGFQPQRQTTVRYAPAAPLAQPPQYIQPQQYNQPQPQQYIQPQPQQYVAPQQQQYPYSAPATNGFFATGPYAAQYQQPNIFGRQLPQYPQTVVPQQQQQAYAPAVAASAPLVSRVAFNGPVGGFTYSF